MIVDRTQHAVRGVNHPSGEHRPVPDANDGAATPPATAATDADDLDPRVSELVGFADATRTHGLSYWTLHNAWRAGRLRGVHVPGGAVGLLRTDVQAFVRQHRVKLAQRRQVRAEKRSTSDQGAA